MFRIGVCMINESQSLDVANRSDDKKLLNSIRKTEINFIPKFVLVKFELSSTNNLKLINWSDNIEQLFEINNNDNNFFDQFINKIEIDDKKSRIKDFFINSILNSFENKNDWFLEFGYKLKDDSIIYIQALAKINKHEDNLFLDAVFIDIIDKKLEEKKSSSSEEKFSILFNSLPDMVFVTRKSDGIILEANDTVENIYSISKQDLIGKSTNELKIWENKDREKTLKDLILNNQNSFDLKINLNPDFILDGVISFTQINYMGEECYLSRFRDLTDLRNTQKDKELLQERILQMQKLDSIGRLAGGIAHDFNNMLTPILGYSELLQKQLADQPISLEKVNKILKAVNRAKDLVQQLLTIASKQIIELEIVNINLIINNFISILTKSIREDIKIKCDLEFPIDNIMASVDQIEQILFNLSINSQEAMPNGGILRISTKNIKIMQDSTISKEIEIGEYVVLSIKDNGIGMSKDTISKIFEPFFTTKSFSLGMGLGMATVYGIVNQLKANILIDSNENQGTEISIYFKKVESSNEVQLNTIKNQKMSVLSNATILLVEENEKTRSMAKEFLNYASYSVLDFSNFEDAFIQSQTRISEVSLLISEIKLLDDRASLLYQILLEINPKLKILFMSEFNADLIFSNQKQNSNNFIQKPFILNSFLTKVKEILES